MGKRRAVVEKLESLARTEPVSRISFHTDFPVFSLGFLKEKIKIYYTMTCAY